MKTYISYIVGIAALLFSSCAKENVVNSRPDTSSDGFSITASVSETKTANDGMNTKWVAGDRITLYHAPAGTSEYTKDNPFVITEANLASNRFTGSLNGTIDPAASYDWYAVYPYTESETAINPTCIPVTIATSTAVQSQVGGTGSMSNICGVNIPLWGKATCDSGTNSVNLQMKNMAALLKFKVLNTYFDSDFKLKNIWVKIGDEAIVGTFTVDLTQGEPVFTAVDAKTSMQLDINQTEIVLGNVKSNGVQYAEVYAAIKPFVAQAGTLLRITVTGEVNGESKSYENSMTLPSAVSFNAGKIREINVRTTADPVYICEADVVAMPADLAGQLNGASFIDKDRLALSTINSSNEGIWVYSFKDKSSVKIMDVGTGVYPWKIKYNASDNKVYFISKANGYVRWVNPDDKSNGYAVNDSNGQAKWYGAGRGFMDIEFDKDNNMYVLERDNYTVAKFSKSSGYSSDTDANEGYFYFGSPRKPLSMCTDGSKLYVATYKDDGTESRLWSKDLSSGTVTTIAWGSGNVISMMMDAQGRLLWANNSNKIYRTKLKEDGTQESLSGIESGNVYGWPDGGFMPAELVPSPDGKNAFYIIDSAHNKVHKITIY